MAAKRQLEFSARSLANMEVIKLHITADNPAAAIKVIQSVLSTSGELIDFPMLGHTEQRTGTLMNLSWRNILTQSYTT